MFQTYMRRPWRTLAIAVPVVAVAAAAVVAGAGGASASPLPGSLSVVGSEVRFTAGNGTLNDLVVRHNGGGIEVEDMNGAIVLNTGSAGGCTQATARKVVCPAIPNVRVRALLGDGADTYNSLFTDVPAYVDGSDGDDTFFGSPSADTLLGGNGNDTIYGSSGDDTINGGADVDDVFGNDGNDTINGGAADDDLSGGPGDDTMNGGAGKDKLSGDEDVDTLRGGSGVDALNGGAGDDVLHGDNDADVLKGDGGNDRLVASSYGDYYGGADVDTVDYSGWGRVWVSIDDKWNDGPQPCGDWIGCPVVVYHNVRTDVENVIGSNGNDSIFGSNAPNGLDGGAGNDVLEGKGGRDYLDAESGTGQRTVGGDDIDTCVGYNITRVTCEL